MHLASLLDDSLFVIEDHNRPSGRAEVLPRWGTLDRFGIVITEPYGAIGASLLVQLAVLAFYEAKPERRTSQPEYPEIYLFHFGGRFGDHRPFDFWPPRKEVFLPRSPMALLESLNERGITFLALPEGPGGDQSALSSAPVPWAERNSYVSRAKGAFVYSPTGKVTQGEFSLSAADVVLESNGHRAMNPDISLNWFQNLREEEKPNAMPGPSSLHETNEWERTFMNRYREISPDVRAAVSRRRTTSLVNGKARETYARLTPESTLARMAGLVEVD